MNPRILVLVALLGCGVAVSRAAELQTGTGATRPTPLPPVSAKVTVEMIAATLGDDCGGASVPTRAPGLEEKSQSGDSLHDTSVARRRCQQTSMQLAIVSPAGAAPTQIRVKKVELVDEKGKRIGLLTPGSPMAWSDDGRYQPWDQNVVAGKSLAVSYALSQPDWSRVKNRFNKIYQLKVVVSVGGVDQALRHDVSVVTEVSLPPDVVT